MPSRRMIGLKNASEYTLEAAMKYWMQLRRVSRMWIRRASNSQEVKFPIKRHSQSLLRVRMDDLLTLLLKPDSGQGNMLLTLI